MSSFEQRDNQKCRGKHIFQGSILGICGAIFVDFFVEGEEGVGFLLRRRWRRRRRHIVSAVLWAVGWGERRGSLLWLFLVNEAGGLCFVSSSRD